MTNPIKNFTFKGIPNGTQEIMKIISKIFNEMKKRIIISIIIVILLVLSIFLIFFKKEKATFALAEVVRGDIVQEVSETGQLKKGEEASLNFRNSGEIKEIFVETGDKVESGQVLAKLDTSQLEIQLAEAKAGLAVIEAGRKDAQISLESARQKLEDTLATANENLEKAYTDAQSDLDNSYLKIYNSFSFISLLKNTYFGRGDIESINIAENKDRIEIQLNQVKFYIDKAKNSQGEEDIETALSETGKALLKVKTALEDTRNMMETGNYHDIVPIADKNTLDAHKLSINTCYSNVIDSQANISLTKTTNTTDVNAAQSEVSVLENQLNEGENGLYLAQINQARAQKQLLEKQIEDSYLKSPTQGQITEVNKKIGEMVQPTSSDGVMTFLPTNPFEIEVNIYEEDVVKINIGNPVDISLIPIPERIFKGKVGIIDPAEKIIDGVIYYKIRIFFDTSTGSVSTLSEAERVEEGLPQNLKPGMTADVKIKTASKENVLIVSNTAIQEKDGKKIIQILKDKRIEDREVEIGLEGSDNMVEIISGVEEGEKAVIR